ncbi:MAG: prepilin-type N-terminal cleavage/methylation domain-containing protein [Fibrobacteria bacterium]
MKRESGISQKGVTLIEILAAVIIVGVGIALFTKVQSGSRGASSTNTRILIAGKKIEKYLEDSRIAIAKDSAKYPPVSQTISGSAPDFISLVVTVTDALSPKDGAIVNNVKCVGIKAAWTNPRKDSLKVTTYISKRF